MAQPLFEKAGLFTDIHFGKSGDSEVHNKDCLRYLNWLVESTDDCDSLFFLGDWFDNQTKIRKDTHSYSNEALEFLNGLRKPVYILVGNHDMYFKTSRKHHALQHTGQFKNITLVETLAVDEDFGPGYNNIYAYFAQTPLDNPYAYSIYRAALRQIRYYNGEKEPDWAEIPLGDGDFFAIEEK